MQTESDEQDFTFGPTNEVANGTPPARRLSQLSLFEVFFIVTLSALSLWVYIALSPLIAMLCAGCLIVVASVRWFGSRHAVVSGLFGFGAASLVSLLIVGLHGAKPSLAAFLMLAGPTSGYLIGAIMSVIAEDDSL